MGWAVTAFFLAALVATEVGYGSWPLCVCLGFLSGLYGGRLQEAKLATQEAKGPDH